MSKLATLIATEEGFFVPGSVPNRNANPGDLEHAPGEAHTTSSPIGSFDTADEGWAALERQLNLYAQRGLTLREAIYEFAPPTENDSEQYLEYVCAGLAVPDTTLVSEALEIT
jgi:hypothetical protein